VEQVYAWQGAGHSVGLHSTNADRALQLGLRLPVSRVIVNQAHCIATGGSFDNGLPFSLSMGCGTWGRNNFSDNMNYRHYLNITRISRPIAERVPNEEEIFGAYFGKFGRG
jgi:sulfoacetaldehyde dehydrogenase